MLVGGWSFFLAAGCSDMRDIDARTDALMRERSERLGGGAVAPNRVRPIETNLDAPVIRSNEPPSVNAEVQDMPFSPADANRDVAARLAEYTAMPTEAMGAVRIDMKAAMRQMQQTGRSFLVAEEDYVLAAITLLIIRHRWDPQFFNDTTLGVATTRTVSDSNYQSPLSIINTLRATQRLPYGGQAEAAWIYNATEQLRDQATASQYQQSSRLVLSGNIPLLRGAGDVAREDIIDAERQLVYSARDFERRRRELLVEVATDYISLVQQQAVIANQERSLEFAKAQEQRTRALVEAGRSSEFSLGISSGEVLSSTSTLASLREQYVLAIERFKVKLGLPINRPLVVATLDFELAEPQITPESASLLALEYRLDLQNQRDRVDDQIRAVRNARNNLLPDVSLSGAVTARTDPNVSNTAAVYRDRDFVYGGGLTVSLPLDRQTEQLTLRAANLRLERVRRDLEQSRDLIIIESRAKVRELDLARFNLQLAERRVAIALRRREEQEIKAAEVNAQQFVETAREIRDAENARDQAVARLRTTVLEYLLVTGQLRVERDGTLMPLPGMTTQPSPTGTDYTAPPPAQPPAVTPPAAVPLLGP